MSSSRGCIRDTRRDISVGGLGRQKFASCRPEHSCEHGIPLGSHSILKECQVHSTSKAAQCWSEQTNLPCRYFHLRTVNFGTALLLIIFLLSAIRMTRLCWSSIASRCMHPSAVCKFRAWSCASGSPVRNAYTRGRCTRSYREANVRARILSKVAFRAQRSATEDAPRPMHG